MPDKLSDTFHSVNGVIGVAQRAGFRSRIEMLLIDEKP